MMMRHKRILIWAFAALAAAVFVLSALFPKRAYEITEYHVAMEEGEEEREIALTPDTTVLFSVSAKAAAVSGIEPCFDWGSQERPGGVICVDAWQIGEDTGENIYIGQGIAALDERLRRAYAYVELPDSELLTGELVFSIRYIPADGETAYPLLIATNRDLETCETVVDGERYDGDLLMYYASVKKTYPLLFDSKLTFLLLVCVALTMRGAHGKEERA